jgi:putative transcriptional regulator
MEVSPTHDCMKLRTEKLATPTEPFHFVDSGLSNVYLAGIRYFVCECGSVTAEIPAIKPLMRLLARDVVESPKPLSGEEVRFLRKRLGKKASDFARDLGLEPETLSRMENGKQAISEQSDKLIRFLYAISSDDQELLEQIRKLVKPLLTAWSERSAAGPSLAPMILKKIDSTGSAEWTDVAAA